MCVKCRIVSEAAFAMRKHSQSRKQTAQTKQKNPLVGSSGKESVSLRGRLRETCPGGSSNVQYSRMAHHSWAVSAPHTTGPVPAPVPAELPHTCCHTAHTEGDRGGALGTHSVTWDPWEFETVRLLVDLRKKTIMWGGFKHHCQNPIPGHLFFLQWISGPK